VFCFFLFAFLFSSMAEEKYVRESERKRRRTSETEHVKISEPARRLDLDTVERLYNHEKHFVETGVEEDDVTMEDYETLAATCVNYRHELHALNLDARRLRKELKPMEDAIRLFCARTKKRFIDDERNIQIYDARSKRLQGIAKSNAGLMKEGIIQALQNNPEICGTDHTTEDLENFASIIITSILDMRKEKETHQTRYAKVRRREANLFDMEDDEEEEEEEEKTDETEE